MSQNQNIENIAPLRRNSQNKQILQHLKQKYRPLKQHKDKAHQYQPLLPTIIPIKSQSLHNNEPIPQNKSHKNSLHTTNKQQPYKPKYKHKHNTQQWLELYIKPPVYIGNEQQHPIVQKAHEQIQILKRLPKNSVLTQEQQNIWKERNSMNVNLDKYLNMLESNRDKKNQNFQKLKKQVERMHLFSHKPYFNIQHQLEQQNVNNKNNVYTLEESRLLNAKIRRKLNHKKMIGLYR